MMSHGPEVTGLRAVIYWLFQFMGAVLGALIAMVSVKTTDYKLPPSFDDPDDVPWTRTAVSEIIGCFFLVHTVLQVATVNQGAYKNNGFFAMAIGFTVVAGATAVGGGDLSGAFNPAVTLGTTLARAYGDASIKAELFFFILAMQCVGALI